MPVAIPEKQEVFPENNIIVGFAEIKSSYINGQLRWELPGGGVTYCRDHATQLATNMDKMIKRNMKAKNCSLLWS